MATHVCTLSKEKQCVTKAQAKIVSAEVVAKRPGQAASFAAANASKIPVHVVEAPQGWRVSAVCRSAPFVSGKKVERKIVGELESLLSS